MSHPLIIERIQQIDPSHWRQLFGSQPLISHPFLTALVACPIATLLRHNE